MTLFLVAMLPLIAITTLSKFGVGILWLGHHQVRQFFCAYRLMVELNVCDGGGGEGGYVDGAVGDVVRCRCDCAGLPAVVEAGDCFCCSSY